MTLANSFRSPLDRLTDGAHTGNNGSNWNVDLTSRGDTSMVARSTSDVPKGFAPASDFFDAPQQKLDANQEQRGDSPQRNQELQMQLLVRLLQAIVQVLRHMLAAQNPGGSDQPSQPPTSGGSDRPHTPSGGSDQPQAPPRATDDHPPVRTGGGDHPQQPSKPTPHDTPDTPSKPDKPTNNGGSDTKPKPTNDGGSDNNPKPKPETPDHNDSDSGHTLADTGIKRGRTIYRDDFNGARGERPNQNVFDTAHIGPEGQTRQRGPSIHEDAIINQNNTVMDGDGHLVLFAQKQRTFDDKADEYVNYTKGSLNTGKGLHFNLKDHPDGVVIEVRAKHPTAPGAKFDALWIMTDHWAADPKKGEKEKDTVEFDAAEGGGADITVHYPVKDASGNSVSKYGGGAHPTDVKFDDGQWHTYTVVIKPNKETGRGDVVEYVDGKKEFSKESVFPGDKDLHLRTSLEVSPKWTHKTLTGEGGMDSTAAGELDYLDFAELAPHSS